MIGLVGSHRCGKTSLARQYALKHGIPFLETSVSAIWRELGYDPSALYDFETRLTIQERILERVDAKFAEFSGREFITDRTPLDMAAYLIGDAIGDRVPDSCQERVKKYVADCFEATNRRFGVVILIQPGIPLVKEEGKAAMNEAYIEHLNSLMLGLTCDERLRSCNFYLPRAVVDMDRRIGALEAAIGRAKATVVLDYKNQKDQGELVLH
jgi:hypothetical protein